MGDHDPGDVVAHRYPGAKAAILLPVVPQLFPRPTGEGFGVEHVAPGAAIVIDGRQQFPGQRPQRRLYIAKQGAAARQEARRVAIGHQGDLPIQLVALGLEDAGQGGILDALQRQPEQPALGQPRRDGPRPVEKGRCAGIPVLAKFFPGGLGVDRRHVQQQIEAGTDPRKATIHAQGFCVGPTGSHLMIVSRPVTGVPMGEGMKGALEGRVEPPPKGLQGEDIDFITVRIPVYGTHLQPKTGHAGLPRPARRKGLSVRCPDRVHIVHADLRRAAMDGAGQQRLFHFLQHGHWRILRGGHDAKHVWRPLARLDRSQPEFQQQETVEALDHRGRDVGQQRVHRRHVRLRGEQQVGRLAGYQGLGGRIRLRLRTPVHAQEGHRPIEDQPRAVRQRQPHALVPSQIREHRLASRVRKKAGFPLHAPDLVAGDALFKPPSCFLPIPGFGRF